MGVLAVEKNDGSPLTSFEAVVDAGGLRLHFSLKLGIPRNIAACGSTDLDKGKFSLIPRMAFKKRLYGLEALDDSFRVVDAIDADSKKGGIDSQLSD